MPPMTLLGWFHTIFGIAAVLLAASALYRQGAISASDRIGKLYLIVTVIVAGSALGIYNQGGFGIAHILAVLTLARSPQASSLSTGSSLVVCQPTVRRSATAPPSCST